MSAEQDIEQQLRRKLQEEISREQEARDGEEQRTGRHVQNCPAAGARATAEGSAEQAAFQVLKALSDVDPEYIREAGEKLDSGTESDSIHTDETERTAKEQKSDERSAERQEPVSRGGKDIYQVDDLDVKPGTRPETPDDFTEIQMDTLGEDALLPEFDEMEADEEEPAGVRRTHGVRPGRRRFFPGRGSGRRAPDRNSDESFHRHINVWGTMAAAAAICLVAAGLYQNLRRSANSVSQIPNMENARRIAEPTHEELQEAAAAETAEENSEDQTDTGAGASEQSAGETAQGENLAGNNETQSGGTESKQAASRGEGTVTVTGKAAGSSVPVEEQAAADAADSASKTEAAIANPWNTFDTLEEAEACADMEIAIPDQIDGYSELVYQAIQGDVLEIIYQNAGGEEGLRIRKSSYPDGSGTPDISGDYNSYSQHSTLKSIRVGKEASSQTVNVKLAGDEGIVRNAIWSAKAGAAGNTASTNYAYAIVFDGAELSATEVGKLVSGIY